MEKLEERFRRDKETFSRENFKVTKQITCLHKQNKITNKITRMLTISPSPQKKDKRHFSNLEVNEFLAKNNIKNETELLSKTCEQKNAGKKNLASFLVSKNPKSIKDY